MLIISVFKGEFPWTWARRAAPCITNTGRSLLLGNWCSGQFIIQIHCFFVFWPVSLNERKPESVEMGGLSQCWLWSGYCFRVQEGFEPQQCLEEKRHVNSVKPPQHECNRLCLEKMLFLSSAKLPFSCLFEGSCSGGSCDLVHC